MLLRLQNAAAAMTELGRQQDRVANNLANANTTGFKRQRTFTEALAQRLDREGAPASERTTAQWLERRPGVLEPTGNPLDLALQGEGFFVVADAAGALRYTRAGRFAPDAEGTLRTPEGLVVMGTTGPITLPPGGPVEVDADGTVRAGGLAVGTLRVVRFDDETLLERAEGATFLTDAEPLAVDRPAVRQGFLEASTVDPVAEMTEMIAHVRLFEAHQRVLQTHNDLLGRVAGDLGRF